MPEAWSEASRAVLARYARQSRATRWHVAGRLRSCPFARIIPHLPPSGVVASLGCGHGVFELLLASRGCYQRVIGADPSVSKIRGAQAAADASPPLPVSFHHGDLLDVLRTEGIHPDAVILVDVLYLIPRTQHRELFADIRNHLAPNGHILVKDMGTKPRAKALWNRAQETLACRVLRITHAPATLDNFISETEWVPLLHAAGFEEIRILPIHAGYPHPHLLVVARKSGES